MDPVEGYKKLVTYFCVTNPRFSLINAKLDDGEAGAINVRFDYLFILLQLGS